MNTYEMDEVIRAIEVANGTNAYYGRPDRYESNHRHQYDYIVRMVCIGCGGTLRRFEIRNHLAYCYRCRRFLFPETVWEDMERSR